MSNLVFLYHTLKRPEIQREVLGHDAEVVASPFTIHNYSQVTHKLPDSSYPTLVHAPRAQVTGEIISVSDGDLKRLMVWESDYHLIHVAAYKGRAVVAFILRDDAGHFDPKKYTGGDPDESVRDTY